eukprot:gb/GECG01006882.1/.p1 GENE.gb/GECG01006882.1/~~gb/GECG01006882.1/.p1  ORF type:complete len:166 (+),score=6.07 gb/GECG01006882.1/:1-498(+)
MGILEYGILSPPMWMRDSRMDHPIPSDTATQGLSASICVHTINDTEERDLQFSPILHTLNDYLSSSCVVHVVFSHTVACFHKGTGVASTELRLSLFICMRRPPEREEMHTPVHAMYQLTQAIVDHLRVDANPIPPSQLDTVCPGNTVTQKRSASRNAATLSWALC